MVLARWGRNCIELCIACNWVELYFELKIYLFKRIMNNDEINLSSNKVNETSGGQKRKYIPSYSINERAIN